jgi:hypothetical protein
MKCRLAICTVRVLVVCYLVGLVALSAGRSHAAQPDEQAPLHIAPERILLGHTGQVASPGSLRLTLHGYGVAQSASFVPLEGLEVSVSGTPFMISNSHALVVPMVRYAPPGPKWLRVSVGAAWGQEYRGIGDDHWDRDEEHSYYPTAEVAVTLVMARWRLNLCARYILVPDRNAEYDGQVLGIDDVFVHIGLEWALKKSFHLFAEPTLILPIDPVDDIDRHGPDNRGTSWDYTDGADHSLLFGLGARFLPGRWSLDVAIINSAWGNVFPSLVFYFTASALFDLF